MTNKLDCEGVTGSKGKIDMVEHKMPDVHWDDAELKPYNEMTREELIDCCKAHDYHHKEHHEKEEKQQWRPIESAPRDGSSVLLWCKHKTDEYFSIVQGSWFEAQFYADSREYIIDWEDGLTAAHWMPLPQPPESEG